MFSRKQKQLCIMIILLVTLYAIKLYARNNVFKSCMTGILFSLSYTIFYSFLEEYNSNTKDGIKIEPFDQCGRFFQKHTRRNELKFCGNRLDCEKNVGKLSSLSNPLLVMKTLNIQRNTNAKFFKNVFRAAWNFHSRHYISHNKTNMIASDQCNKLFGRTDNMLQHKKISTERHLEIYV